MITLTIWNKIADASTQRIPIIGEHFHKEIPPSDNVCSPISTLLQTQGSD